MKRFRLSAAQAAIAGLLAGFGYWQVALLLAAFALLLLIPAFLHGADKTNQSYLMRVHWAFRATGAAFFLLAALQTAGAVGYATPIAIPLGYAAGVAFVYVAEKVVKPARDRSLLDEKNL